MIKFHFQIDPVPKARPRVTRTGHCYTPKKTKDFEETIKHLATLQMHRSDHGLLECPLSVKAHFFIKEPKKPSKPYPRYDLDNLIKSLLDSLNGVVWRDDSQICTLTSSKAYAKNGSAHLWVESLK